MRNSSTTWNPDVVYGHAQDLHLAKTRTLGLDRTDHVVGRSNRKRDVLHEFPPHNPSANGQIPRKD